VVISIGGLDEYKEYSVEHGSAYLLESGTRFAFLDMPGTGEAPVKWKSAASAMLESDRLPRSRRDIEQAHRHQWRERGRHWSALTLISSAGG